MSSSFGIRQRCQLAEVITICGGDLRSTAATKSHHAAISESSGHGWRRHPEFLKDRLERNTDRVQLLNRQHNGRTRIAG
jgi:hypothetical protein